MVGDTIALDTNVVITILNSPTPSDSIFHSNRKVYLPFVVVGELYFGALNSEQTISNYKRYQSFIADCKILDSSDSVMQSYAEIRLQLKRKGSPIPENDLWIAAACQANDMDLMTFDKHFARIEGLSVFHSFYS